MKCTILLLCLANCIRLMVLSLDINEQFMQRVLHNLNRSVEPCDDFYAYACGSWSLHHQDTSSYFDMAGYVDHQFNTQLLQALKLHKTDPGIYAQLWAYHNSCCELKLPVLNPFLHALEAELQLEWPIFRHNHSLPWRNETRFDWLATLGKLRVYGLNGIFIRQDVSVRHNNSTHYLLELEQQSAEARLLEQPAIHELYMAFGLDQQLARNLTAQVMSLQRRLQLLTQQQQIAKHSRLEAWTVAELQQRVPQIDWQHYLSAVLGAAVHPDSQAVQIAGLNGSYFEQLELIFRQSSNETLCYYLMFQLMFALQAELPAAVGEAQTALVCLAQLRGHMPLAMNFLYEQHFYAARRNSTDAALRRLLATLVQQFERLLQENRLQLSDSESRFVLEELQGLRLKIGNLPLQLDARQLAHYYAELQLQSHNFYGNKLQLLRFYTRREQEQLTNVAGLWPLHAYYQLLAVTERSSSPAKLFYNAVLLPFGYLQLPVYAAELNELLQHSVMGFLLAHELVHAYDMFHIVYDARGNYNGTGLAVLQHFLPFINCYVRQPKDHLLLSESMADIVGLRLAYAAYFDGRQHQLCSGCGNFTLEQLFFINSVQFLCANFTSLRTIKDEEHGQHNERVNRNWPHHDRFAAAFHCAPAQPMHLAHRCRLW